MSYDKMYHMFNTVFKVMNHQKWYMMHSFANKPGIIILNETTSALTVKSGKDAGHLLCPRTVTSHWLCLMLEHQRSRLCHSNWATWHTYMWHSGHWLCISSQSTEQVVTQVAGCELHSLASEKKSLSRNVIPYLHYHTPVLQCGHRFV